MKKKPVLILFVLALTGYLLFVTQQKKGEPSTSSEIASDSNGEQSQNTTDPVDMLLDVLETLSSYHLSTVTVTDFEDTTTLMTDLMNAKRYMQDGDRYVEKYVESSNEYISVTAFGMITGSQKVQQSTENFIQYLRGINENDPSSYTDLQYQTAQYLSGTKEGYQMIAVAAPQVTALLWEPASSENPVGSIPYTISKEERQRIINRIDKLFSDALVEYRASSGSYNSMIFAVDSIKNNIEPDTYEEAKE